MNTKPLLLFVIAAVIIAGLFYAVTATLSSSYTSTGDSVSTTIEKSKSDISTDISLTNVTADSQNENKDQATTTDSETSITTSDSTTQNTGSGATESTSSKMTTYTHESGVTVEHPSDWTYQFKNLNSSKQFSIWVTPFDEVPETGGPYGDDKETYRAEATAINAGEDIISDTGSTIPVVTLSPTLKAKYTLSAVEGSTHTEKYTFYTDTYRVIVWSAYDGYLFEKNITKSVIKNHIFTADAPEELRTRSAELRTIAESIDLSALE